MTEYEFEVGVIGAGPAGLAAAYAARALGKQVAILEDYLWGGTCPNYGCDPKKILLAAVEGIHRQSALQNLGLRGLSTIDWSALMAHKQRYVDAVEPRKIRGLDDAGITRFYGRAAFVNDNTVAVGDTGNQIKAQDWVIATGQRPKTLTFPGAEFTQDSEAFLNLPAIPYDVTFIGAGYIGMEFANITQAAGAHTRIVTAGPTALRSFDQTLVRQLITDMQETGIDWYFNATVQRITQTPAGRLMVTLVDGTQFETDRVFATAGRVANADQLQLENAGVIWETTEIPVDDHLRTSNPHIYAIGDVGGSPVAKLVPTGNHEGRYVAQVITGLTTAPITYPAIPVVVFGTQHIAQVGLSVEAGLAKGYRVTDIDMSQVMPFYRYNDTARVRTVLDDAGHIVGASVIAAEAEEVINYFVTAINERRTLAETQANLYAYPSLGSEFATFY
ncbi:dihydrolipoyl dehydrogenase family protein [Leuconostoc lactis]